MTLGESGGTLGSARLARLGIRDFRNLAHVELAPPPDGLAIVGDNGQGKTNLLEAIYYLQILRSARGARDQDLVRFGADGFHIAASVETNARHEVGVGFELAGKRKRVRIDGAVPERMSDALGSLPSVMFSPADVELVGGSPTARRRYLDIMLALTTPGYLAALQRYRAALARRNAALRESARNARGASDERRRLGASARRAWSNDPRRTTGMGGGNGVAIRAPVRGDRRARAGTHRVRELAVVEIC